MRSDICCVSKWRLRRRMTHWNFSNFSTRKARVAMGATSYEVLPTWSLPLHLMMRKWKQAHLFRVPLFHFKNHSFLSSWDLSKLLSTRHLREEVSNIIPLINTKVQGGNTEGISDSNLTKQSEILTELALLKEVNQELNLKIASKNIHIQSANKEFAALKPNELVLINQVSDLQKELEKAKFEVQQLRLRATRGAPYY